jgi:hypothetical protein
MKASASYPATTNEAGTTAAIASSIASAITGAVSKAAIAIATTEPGACTNEDATVKPRGSIVSIRRAGIGCIPVVAPLADRSAIIAAVAAVPRADADTEANLSMRVGRRNHQNTKQREIT